MICFPNAKINLGLRVLRKRSDGYHDIESIFFPIPLSDILEIVESDADTGCMIEFSSGRSAHYSHSGLGFVGDPMDDLIVKACELYDRQIGIPFHIHIHIHKLIPSGAGLGGGSSDAAHTLLLLDRLNNHKAGSDELLKMSSNLGSDCPFFLLNEPCLGLGRGEQLSKVDFSLKGFWLLLVKPSFGVSTAEAYSGVIPNERLNESSLVGLLNATQSNWKQSLVNDFESGVFSKHGELSDIKSKLYQLGAVYASMSGSGSTMFGIFEKVPVYSGCFDDCFTFCSEL
ncbi:MAG: 4-(cytidine 5'-diphospho)-2-C-methyl-D-erythritol kinase [Bacteroidota bacterium]